MVEESATKSMSLKRCLSAVFLILTILFSPLHALNSSDRGFNRESLEAFRNDPAFNYAQDDPSDSFINRMLALLLSAFAGLFNTTTAQWLIPLLFNLLIILGMLVVVWLIVSMKYGSVLSKKNEQFGNFAISDFEQQEEDYEKLLKERPSVPTKPPPP